MSPSEDREILDPGGPADLAAFDATPACLDNFAGDAIRQWQLTAAATGPSCRPGRDILGTAFPLRYWMVHPVEIEQPDGELIQAARVVLFDTSGNCWGFVSEGVYKSLRLLVTKVGEIPEEGIRVVISEGRSRLGRSFYSIEPAPERRAVSPPREDQ